MRLIRCVMGEVYRPIRFGSVFMQDALNLVLPFIRIISQKANGLLVSRPSCIEPNPERILVPDHWNLPRKRWFVSSMNAWKRRFNCKLPDGSEGTCLISYSMEVLGRMGRCSSKWIPPVAHQSLFRYREISPSRRSSVWGIQSMCMYRNNRAG